MNHKTKKIHFVMVCLLSVLAVAYSANVTVPTEFPSISAAMASVKKGDTVWVEDGIYKDHIFVTPGVSLISKATFKAIINGTGRGTIVTMGNGSSIKGFEIKNGTIGVFSTAAGVKISQCRIVFNQQTGIMCVGNLPVIEDNVIVYNNGSGIQGWDVRSTSASINHNTVAYNNNHGVSIGGNSSIIVENNIIAFNNQFGIKPSEENVRITLLNNNFYQNTRFTGVLPSDNYSFNPEFSDSKSLNFALSKDSRCIGRGSDNQDLGARVIY